MLGNRVKVFDIFHKLLYNKIQLQWLFVKNSMGM